MRGKHPPRAALLSGPTRLKLAASAAGYGAAELLVTLSVGGFFAWGRAEALLFYAFRPWLLLVAAILIDRRHWQDRAILYVMGLLLATISQSIFLMALGAENPWPEAARGLVAGLLLAAVVDAAVQLGRRFLGGRGTATAAAALALLFVMPGGLRAYEAIVLGSAEGRPGPRHDLMMLTGLPLVWGEKGPLDAGSRPAASFNVLEREFRIRSLDILDQTTLDGRLLFLAQPRALAPAELAALDAWVRAGGRALILTDPMLAWPSELPLGDMRRPPAIGLLAPLLEHWGLRMEGGSEQEVVSLDLPIRGATRRIITFAPGTLASTGPSCRIEAPQIAECRIGKGRAIVVADADMLHDRLWVGPGSRGGERHARISDNPLAVADWLDLLAQRSRERIERPIEWRTERASRTKAILFALLPLVVAATPAGLVLARRRG